MADLSYFEAWRLSDKELDDVEEVVDLRDCVADLDLGRASTASSRRQSTEHRRHSDAVSSPNSASHVSDEIDIDSVLRALACEVTDGPEASNLAELLSECQNTPQRHARLPAEAARSESSILPSETFSLDWLTQLSRRSSATGLSVPSEEEALSTCSPASPEWRLAQAERSSQVEQSIDMDLQEEILQSVEAEDGGSEHGFPGDLAEEMISVVDIADEPDDESMQGQLYGMSIGASSRSSFFASPRPVESTVASLLQRLALENQMDETIASSIRGVLEVQELLSLDPDEHLTEEEILQLPTFPYAGAGGETQCAICLDAFQEKEAVTMLRCTHFFHAECVAHWMQRAAQCPLCRAYCL